MQLAGLWRYPVKSMQGEAVEDAYLDGLGIRGDRRFGVVDTGTGRVLSAKREGRLLSAVATTAQPVKIRLPDGEVVAGSGVDAALSAWLGRSVRLGEADPAAGAIFESQSDFFDDGSETGTWQGVAGSLVDSNPVHVLTTASLEAMAAERPDLDWQVVRFRPNLLVDAAGRGRVEDDWVGLRLAIGTGGAELEVVEACERCVMITRAQKPAGVGPAVAERQLDLLRHLNDRYQGLLGVLARVVSPGPVRRGDPVVVR